MNKKETDKILIDYFNQGAELARNNKYNESIKMFQKIIYPNENDKSKFKEDDFLAESYLRIAYNYMELKRIEEAKKIFDSKELILLLQSIPPETQYEYYRAFAHTLGLLGDINGMDKMFSIALDISEKKLRDHEKILQIWLGKYHYANYYEEWEYLKDISESGIFYGQIEDDKSIELISKKNLCFALQKLGKIKEAKIKSESLINEMKSLNIDGKIIKEIEMFLE